MAINAGHTVWLLISVSMAVIMFFLLTSVGLCSAQQFCATQVFFTILIGSLVMIFSLLVIDHPSAQKMLKQNLIFFFFREWNWKNLLWIPLGLGIIFAGAYLGSLVNQPILSISIAGIIMLVALYRTNSIAIPIFIHGIYNSVVVYLRAGGQASLLHSFALNPTFVPNFGNNIFQYSGLVNELVFQLFLVAIAEEVFKVFIITFIIVGAKRKFDVSNSFLTWAAGFASVTIWTAFHLIANSYG